MKRSLRKVFAGRSLLALFFAFGNLRKNMKIFKKKWFWFLLLAVVALVAWRLSGDKREETAEVYTVSRENLRRSISVSGHIRPAEFADLFWSRAQLTLGPVKEVRVKVGQRVSRGEKLVLLDDKTARERVLAASFSARAQEELEKSARRRWEDLKPEERNRYKYLSAAARAQVREAKISPVLTSPLDGTITEVNVKVGQAPQPTKVARVIDPDSFRIEALISEADIVDLREGMKAQVSFEARPGETFSTVLSSIEPEATSISDAVYYRVYFALPDEAVSFARSGMSVDLDIVAQERKNVPAVPRRFISADERGYFVRVLTDEKTASSERRQVRLGMVGDDAMTEVLSGLREGEKIIQD